MIRVGQIVPGPAGGARPDGSARGPSSPVGIRPGNVDSSQVPGLVSGLSDRSDRFVFVEFAVADPCHPKAADLDEDPADGLQQFVLLGRADQGLVTLVERLQRPVQSGQFLLRPLSLDALCDTVSHHLERLKSVLTKKLMREHRQNTNQTAFDQQRIARKGYHFLLFSPTRDDLSDCRLVFHLSGGACAALR